MPKDVCDKCKLVKNVKLCADDLLCRECDMENERQLAAIYGQKSAGLSSPVVPVVPAGPIHNDPAMQHSGESTHTSSSEVPTESHAGRAPTRDEAVDKTSKKGKDRRHAVANVSRKIADTRGSKGNVEDASEKGQSVEESRSMSTDRASRDLTSNAEAASLSAASGPQLIVDELMSYVSFYRNKSNVDALRRTVLSFYSPIDICRSKKLLIREFSSLLTNCSFVAERRNSTTRAAHEAEIDDIVNIIDALDLQGVFDSRKFVAWDHDNLPKFGPEEINIAAVVDRQVRVEAAIQDISAKVHQLSTTQIAADNAVADGLAQLSIQSMVTNMQQKLDAFSQSVTARLDHLNTVCGNSLNVNVSHDNNNGSHNAIQSDNVDRKMNIIIFGVKETRDVAMWRQNIDDILHFVTDHSVDVIDMFRLGRFNAEKTRPVLVKLRTAWDKRLILSRASKLKQFNQRGVFIVPDEPIEVRRKQAFDRLKYRAERAGKRVAVNDGILVIDDVAEFSLVDGFLNNTRHG